MILNSQKTVGLKDRLDLSPVIFQASGTIAGIHPLARGIKDETEGVGEDDGVALPLLLG